MLAAVLARKGVHVPASLQAVRYGSSASSVQMHSDSVADGSHACGVVPLFSSPPGPADGLYCMLDTAKETLAAKLGRTLSNMSDKYWRLSDIEDECKQAELKQLREVVMRPCRILPGSILT